MESGSNHSAVNNKTRHLVLRLLFALLWFIGIYQIILMVLGAFVGLLTTGPFGGYEDAYIAAQIASEEFFDRYTLLILISVAGLVSLSTWYEILPGTNKSKNPAIGFKDRWFASSSWLRYLLTLVISGIVGLIWGILSILLRFPRFIVAPGIVLIILVIVGALNRKRK